MPASRILLADDDPVLLHSMSTVLREQGYHVRTAQGGRELFDEMEAEAPDLLLLDVVMPDNDGFEALTRIKSDERWRDIPVLMVSSQSPEDATEKTLGLGAADYLRKPVKPRELLARVRSQLRLRAILRSTREALRQAEEELSRARDEAENRRKIVDILHEVTGDLSTDEIYHLLARRVARALALSRCSVVLAKPGDRLAVVATAFDDPKIGNQEIDLDRYPEIRAAIDSGSAVLIEDVSTSPLYDTVRKEWAAQGRTVPFRSVIALPFTLDDEQVGVFFLRRTMDEPPLTRDDVEFADTVIRAAVAAIQRARLIETAKSENARLEVLAHTDPLTQVVNRRALGERLSVELGRARRYDSVLSVLMLDLDHFKDVNDTHGHLVGDDVLREIGAVLLATVRSVDVVARYGGEEFVVILPETPLAGAVTFAERLRALIEDHAFSATERGLRITASVGVATFPADGIDSVEDLLARADEALYRAKAEGRNKVAS